MAMMAIIGFGLHEMAGVTHLPISKGLESILALRVNLWVTSCIASLVGFRIYGMHSTRRRYGLMPPLLFGISCCVFGMSILLLKNVTYFLRMCLIGFGWSIALPYVKLLASIDKKGSALAAGNSFATIGGAAGAARCNLIGQTGNYIMLLQSH